MKSAPQIDTEQCKLLLLAKKEAYHIIKDKCNGFTLEDLIAYAYLEGMKSVISKEGTNSEPEYKIRNKISLIDAEHIIDIPGGKLDLEKVFTTEKAKERLKELGNEFDKSN